MRARPEHRIKWLTVAGLVLLAVAAARGQIAVPMYVGNVVPVLDPYGAPMAGTIEMDPSERSRVEIRTAPNFVIYPPNTNGIAHPNNALMFPDSVGGIGDNTTSPGQFAMTFPLRPNAGTRVFGRVFNRPTVEEASFYADSLIALVHPSELSMVLTFGPAKPLDSGDADGDGLINSWEKELGTDDRLTGDYDNDGFGDLDEHLAGTDPKNPHSLLEFNLIARHSAESVRLRFQTVPGRTYQLEVAPTLLSPQEFTAVGEALTTSNGQYSAEVQVPVALESLTGQYRLRTVP